MTLRSDDEDDQIGIRAISHGEDGRFVTIFVLRRLIQHQTRCTHLFHTDIEIHRLRRCEYFRAVK